MAKGLFHLLAGAALALAFALPSTVRAGNAAAASGQQQKMALRSPAFKANSDMPRRFSCQGESVSPPLSWSGVPDGARSLALIVDDPDAPSGTYVHWVVYNLAPDSGGLDEGADKQLPASAALGKNSAGEQGYHGMCPPSGRHHYHFRLYALDMQLAAKNYDKQATLEAMHGHILARTDFVATYRKQ